MDVEPEWYRLDIDGPRDGRVVRVERAADGTFSAAAFYWTRGELSPCPVVTHSAGRGRVTARGVERLRVAVEQCGFWALPEQVGASGWDGSWWVVEAAFGTRSRRVARWSSREDGAGEGFVALCLLLDEIGRSVAGVP